MGFLWVMYRLGFHLCTVPYIRYNRKLNLVIYSSASPCFYNRSCHKYCTSSSPCLKWNWMYRYRMPQVNVFDVGRAVQISSFQRQTYCKQQYCSYMLLPRREKTLPLYLMWCNTITKWWKCGWGEGGVFVFLAVTLVPNNMAYFSRPPWRWYPS